MKNNNGAAIRRLSSRSLKNNRIRNLFAACAIILTSMLFTAAFSMFSGMIQASQESTMHEVGTRAHAGLKSADMQQYEKIAADPLVKKSSYDILLGFAENIQKRQAEIRFMPFEEALQGYFITLQEGHLPEKEDEIVVDTYIMDELKLPHALGGKVSLVFSFMGETFEKEFQVSGYYEGDSIAHASEIFISEPFWQKVKKNRTEADFRAWAKEHPQEEGRGLLSVHLYFDNASHLEEKVREVIANAGYEPETELDYGVNWAYMENRMESIDPLSYAVFAGALAVILLTGYLIIYNIFQISIMNDIRFYGLLKTIGTTKRQLRSLIVRQVFRLSAIGIPIGLLLGYAIGVLGVPILSRLISSGDNLKLSLQFHPGIFVFGALFSAVTVFLSCRKPGKIAGSVSPVEAVKYTESNIKVSEKKRKRRRFSPFSMALANLGRSRKKTAVVIAAISLSMVLLTIVMTGVGSFQLGQFLEARIAGDIMIGASDLFGHAGGSNDYILDEEFVKFTETQPGIEAADEMWTGYGKWIAVDEKGKAGLERLDREGKLDRSYGMNPLEQDTLNGDCFGYTDGLFKNIRVLEGMLDVDKFQNGDYILLECFYGSDVLGPEDSLYHPGDKVTVRSLTKDSTSQEIKNEEGEIMDVVYDHLDEKEYEVMAIVDYPHSMDLSRYTPNGMHMVLPLREFQNTDEPDAFCFAKSYRVKEENREAFEAAVKDYTENVDPMMGYASKQSLEEEFSGMVGVISVIGMTLSGVIALIGILNFINAVFTGIISRKREFAMLQSIGMTAGQLRSVVVCEGIAYVVIAGILSLAVGSVLAYAVLHALNQVVLFFEYRFQILPFLIMLPILLIVAAATPMVSFHRMKKESVVERLRETE